MIKFLIEHGIDTFYYRWHDIIDKHTENSMLHQDYIRHAGLGNFRGDFVDLNINKYYLVSKYLFKD